MFHVSVFRFQRDSVKSKLSIKKQTATVKEEEKKGVNPSLMYKRGVKTKRTAEKKKTAVRVKPVVVKKERPKERPKVSPPKPQPRLARLAEAPAKRAVEARRAKPSHTRPKPPRYYEAVGRRKTAVARVRIWTKGDKDIVVNGRLLAQYFPTSDLRQTALSSLDKMKCQDKFRVEVRVRGGGLSGQAEAIRHGTARVLTLFNPDFRKRLRRVGYLTRDSRMRERKKFGLKRARRAPQWKKR